MRSLSDFSQRMAVDGWALFENMVGEDLIHRLRKDLDDATEQCRLAQRDGNIQNADGTSHHILIFERSFLEFLNHFYLNQFIRHFFNSDYVLNSFGGVITSKNSKSYVLNAHRDVRFFTGDCKLLLNMIVLLDDFTLENGATYLLSGSHLKPSINKDFFVDESDRLIGKAGSIGLFDSNLWHSAGINSSDSPRRAITINFSKGMVKPQFDFLRHFGNERILRMRPEMQQILGFNARVPATLEEWYLPPSERMYKPGQD